MERGSVQNLNRTCYRCTGQRGEEIKQRSAVRPAEIRSQLKSSEGAQTQNHIAAEDFFGVVRGKGIKLAIHISSSC